MLSKYKYDPVTPLLKTSPENTIGSHDNNPRPLIRMLQTSFAAGPSPGCLLCLCVLLHLTWLGCLYSICLSSQGWPELRILPFSHCSARKLSVTQLQVFCQVSHCVAGFPRQSHYSALFLYIIYNLLEECDLFLYKNTNNSKEVILFYSLLYPST